jgi:hypothetical protein
MPSLPKSWVRDVRVMEVIRVESCVGKGIDGDPYRALVQFFATTGELLAERDDWEEARAPAGDNG